MITQIMLGPGLKTQKMIIGPPFKNISATCGQKSQLTQSKLLFMASHLLGLLQLLDMFTIKYADPQNQTLLQKKLNLSQLR